MSLNAANPYLNATVSASAGSGKTWLLITRIVRLLLAGAEPGNIVALTFTRKAAGEMQMRLNQRLLEMATVSDERLVALLAEAGCGTDIQQQQTARKLYERLLYNLYPVRLQTFHSFCQDILAKFPIEADIPPGFELLEDTGLLEQQAWQALFVEATQAPESQLSIQLSILMDSCNGAANTRTALDNFIAHRSDWWAFTRNQPAAVEFAHQQLCQTLQINERIALSDDSSNSTPEKDFFKHVSSEELQVFANLLREQPTKTNLNHADLLDTALSLSDDCTQCFNAIIPVFLKADNTPRLRKDTNTLQTKLGSDNAARFLDLHQSISAQLMTAIDMKRRLETIKLNHAWCFTGVRLLTIFQQLKRQQRLLDFTDLEWKCFELINQTDNVQWIQYKIDQRIDHILIDEFQDTNPTQWHLLAPILEEIAATYTPSEEGDNTERWRSVFLVGDEKQSIYSFRRANPKLQAQASDWLATHLNAEATPLDSSRRSSQAIIDCVNHIFLQDSIRSIMPGYTHHETWLKTLPGKACLSELFQQADAPEDKKGTTEVPVFRNPLEQPLLNDRNDSHFDEACHIASQIQQLLSQGECITDDNRVRHIEYGDIMILMRNRVHIETYENVLRQYRIPFIGSKRGGFLDNVEIQDLIQLLDTLITPFNNLALAQVLRSPIFGATDEDLVKLAELDEAPYWYDRLLLVAEQNNGSEAHTALSRAARLLPRWRGYADNLPVHDCLDRIFVEANILQRYASSANSGDKHRVTANCQRLLELSLENDSGRYPGISHFLHYLNQNQQHSRSPLDEPLVKNDESRVRLLTIHASKGLEAPVVFLADCNSTSSNKSAYATYVNWPENSQRPLNFMLQQGARHTDSITAALQNKKAREAQREDMNLLYVALTRAREQLYISGIKSKRKQAGWYEPIRQAFDIFAEAKTDHNGRPCLIHQHLGYTDSAVAASPAQTSQQSQEKAEASPTYRIDERLLQPLQNCQPAMILLAPSKLDKDSYKLIHDEINEPQDARLRGMVIHRAIELLSTGEAQSRTCDANQYTARLAIEFSYPNDDNFIRQCLQEATDIVNNPEFTEIFFPAAPADTYNELPVLYQQESEPNQEQAVYGLIDRVIKTDTTVYIIDYKSHRIADNVGTQEFAERFRPQMQCYQNGLEKVWPQLEYKSAVLFTHVARLVWL